MGIFDSVTSAVNRGTDSASRAAEKAKLKSQINEINKQRQQLAGQLGASLYDATKDDAALREGREALYDGIAALDAERESCQQQIAALDAAAEAATVITCGVCGARIGGGDLFCSGCGTPVERAQAAAPAPAAGPVCAKCGASMGEGDLFCMHCGARKEEETVVAVVETIES